LNSTIQRELAKIDFLFVATKDKLKKYK